MKQFPRKIFYSVLLVLAWLSFAVEGSHALLSSGTTLTGSTITTGSTSLLLSNSQSGSSTLFSDTRPGFSFTVTPGSADTKYFILKNASTAKFGLDIDALAVLPAQLTGNLANQITIDITPVDATGNPTGPKAELVLESLSKMHLNLGTTINSGETQRYQIGAYLEPTYEGQGESVSFDLIFTGTQHNA